MANNSIGAYGQGTGGSEQGEIGAYEYVAAAPPGGTSTPQGLHKIQFGINPQRSQSLGGELQE